MSKQKNPLFSGAIGSYSGVTIFKESFKHELEYMYRRQNIHNLRAQSLTELGKWFANELDDTMIKTLREDHDNNKDDDR